MHTYIKKQRTSRLHKPRYPLFSHLNIYLVQSNSLTLANIFLLVSTLDQKKIDFFVPSNITLHYTYYRCILKAILIPAEERSAIFSRHSKLHKHPSYLKNGSSVFHTISILFSPLIITFLITFWQYFCFKLFDFLMQFINPLHHRL